MTKKHDPKVHSPEACKVKMMAVHDTLDLLSGKWKISIIGALSINGKQRFMELQRDINGIGAKMLSKELRELEINELVVRTVKDTKPVTVEYELTPYGHTLDPIVMALTDWGLKHRKRIIGKEEPACPEELVSVTK